MPGHLVSTSKDTTMGHRREGLLLLGLLTLLATTGASTWYGRWLAAGEEQQVYDKAATEILSLRTVNTDCGVSVTSVTVETTYTPVADARRPFMDDEVVDMWPVIVTTMDQAVSACYTHYDCGGVAQFVRDRTLPTEVTYVRYMLSGPASGYTTRNDTNDAAHGGQWIGSSMLHRRDGYVCPSDVVDTEWYRATWQARLGDVLPEPIPLTAAGIVRHFKTLGHTWRMWPNAGCMLTPVLLTARVDPDDGHTHCDRLRCPAHTLCPDGFRTRHHETGMCTTTMNQTASAHPNAAQHTRTDASIAGDVAAHGPSAGFRTEDTYLASTGFSMADAPCHYNPTTRLSGGLCGYDLSIENVGDTAAACQCNPDVPLGDVSCQFSASEHCTSPFSHVPGICSESGTCQVDARVFDELPESAFERLAERADWDPSGAHPRAVACHCDDTSVVQAAWCDTSVCVAQVTDCDSDATCVNRVVDCHFDAAALDAHSPTGRVGECLSSRECRCSDFYYGAKCEHHDTFPAPDGPAPACFVTTESVGLFLEGHSWLECSGHGTCHAPAGSTDSTTPTCTCASGYHGPQCQYTECPDCGPFGKCIELTPDTSPTGIFERVCVCAVSAADPDVPLAEVSAITGTCDIDLCLHRPGSFGTLVIAPSEFLSPDPTPPVGVCECTVLGNGLHNAGTYCDEPVCDVDAEGRACGIATLAMVDLLCLPCKDNPLLGACGDTPIAIGAVCDCEDAATLAATGDEQARYWLTGDDVDRYVAEGVVGVGGAAICSPYCVNGRWKHVGDTALCIDCFADGWSGDRCDESACPNGVFDAGLGTCAPDSCGPGWSGFHCNVCDELLGLEPILVDPDCRTCRPGYVVPATVDRATVARDRLCVKCRDYEYCHEPGILGGDRTSARGQRCFGDTGDPETGADIVCYCKGGYTGARCDACAPGYAWNVAPGGEEAAICLSFAALLGCAPIGTRTYDGGEAVVSGVRASDGTFDLQRSACLCLPGFDPHTQCASCAAGKGLAADGTCVACSEAAGCFGPGTAEALCPTTGGAASGLEVDIQTEAAGYSCACHAELGYEGPVCHTCADGGIWDIITDRCLFCDIACGANGVPDCDAAPPVCRCMNGYSGPSCGECTECGPGGECVEGAYLGEHWCACRPASGWTRSSDALSAPCDTCLPGYLPVGVECVPIALACGVGAHIEASEGAQTCFCGDAFLSLPFQPTGRCEECATGGVGPHCDVCSPPCPETSSVCAWASTDGGATHYAQCVCHEGFVDSVEGPCTQCDFPTHQGAYCAACPETCGKGECDVEPLTQATYCRCDTGAKNADPLNPQSPCSDCPAGSTPLTCLPCPACTGASSICAEPPPGKTAAICACLDGFGRPEWANSDGDPCWPLETLDQLDAERTRLLVKGYQPPVVTSVADVVGAYGTAGMAIAAYSAVSFPLGIFALILATGCMCRRIGRGDAAQKARGHRPTQPKAKGT